MFSWLVSLYHGINWLYVFLLIMGYIGLTAIIGRLDAIPKSLYRQEDALSQLGVQIGSHKNEILESEWARFYKEFGCYPNDVKPGVTDSGLNPRPASAPTLNTKS